VPSNARSSTKELGPSFARRDDDRVRQPIDEVASLRRARRRRIAAIALIGARGLEARRAALDLLEQSDRHARERAPLCFAHLTRIGGHHDARLVAAGVALARLELFAERLGETAARVVGEHDLELAFRARRVIAGDAAQDLDVRGLEMTVREDEAF